MNITVKTRTTQAIQQALDDASQAGGGMVSLEPGLYPITTLFLRSNVELNIPAGAVLQGAGTPDAYCDVMHPADVTPENSRKCLISAYDCSNVAITGQGTIDGQGVGFYASEGVPKDQFFKKPPHPRPRMIQLDSCKNVLLSGVTLLNSPGWTCWLMRCEDVHVNGIRIEGCQQMINNDGLDIFNCRRVAVSDSFFRTGDDCIIIRSIRGARDEDSVCEDIAVTNCVLDSWCQGIRLGCPSDGTVRRCTLSNIVFHGRGTGVLSENPVRYLRKNDTGGLLLQDILLENMVLDCGRFPIRLHVDDGIALRGIRNITFRNIRFSSGQPLHIHGNAQSVMEDIELAGVRGTVRGGIPQELAFVRRLRQQDVEVTAELGEALPLPERVHTSWESDF